MSLGSVNHIGIATKSIKSSIQIWEALGFAFEKETIVADQGVRVGYLSGSGHTRIELLEPLGEDYPVGRFIENRGIGVQQIAVDVEDIEVCVAELLEMGVKMINEEPMIGSEGNRIVFIHPSSSGGVLIELVEKALENNQK